MRMDVELLFILSLINECLELKEINNNMPNKEDECTICNSYETFKNLVKDGIPIDEAFYYLMNEAVSEAVEDATRETAEVAFREGYIIAMRTVAGQAEKIADTIEFEDDESECDCEFCKPEECDDCDCEDGECEVDIENLIRRSILDDNK